MKCDANCKYYPVCWCIGEGIRKIGEDCNRYELDRPHGEWKDFSDDGYVECPFCEHATTCDDNIDELHYCFFCGAELRQKEGRADNEV